jgi:hypothetical protein
MFLCSLNTGIVREQSRMSSRNRGVIVYVQTVQYWGKGCLEETLPLFLLASNSPIATCVSVVAEACFRCRGKVFVDRCLAMHDCSVKLFRNHVTSFRHKLSMGFMLIHELNYSAQ